MLKQRLKKLARTSALPFSLCLAPVIVFGIVVRIIPVREMSTIASTRHTWFEKMYESGMRRMGSVVGVSPTVGANAWERHEAELKAAEARAAAKLSPQHEATGPRRGDELAQEQFKRDFGVDNAGELLAPELAHLTPEQERSLEKEMKEVQPRLSDYRERYERHGSYLGELDKVVDALPSIRQRGSRPRVIVDIPTARTTEQSDEDPSEHNPFGSKPNPSVERTTIIDLSKEQEYLSELATLWQEIMAKPPANITLGMPSVDDLLQNLYAGRLTVNDVETATNLAQRFGEASDFVDEGISRMLRVGRLLSELGYHDELAPFGLGGEQTFEDRPQRSTFELPPSLAKANHEQAAREIEERKIKERVRNEHRGTSQATSKEGSLSSLKSFLTDVVDSVQAGKDAETIRMLRSMIPENVALRSVLGDVLPSEQLAALDRYYYAKQRSLDDQEVIDILGPTRWQKFVHVTGLTDEELSTMCPSVSWATIMKSGQKFYRGRCLIEDRTSCRQYDLLVWVDGRWVCLGRFWEAVQLE